MSEIESKFGPEKKRRTVTVGDLVIGRDLVIIAGPCAVESAEQTLRTARLVKQAGGELHIDSAMGEGTRATIELVRV